jgi:hypothetical protein
VTFGMSEKCQDRKSRTSFDHLVGAHLFHL